MLEFIQNIQIYFRTFGKTYHFNGRKLKEGIDI